MKVIWILVFLFALSGVSTAQACAEKAKIVDPVISENARKLFETKLAEARADLAKNPDSADALIWVGRRIAYLGDYRESIRIFSKGIAAFPKDARFLRHRGHRLITLRCFEDAIRDFESAARLIKGKPDEIEPDGLPNARNTPTSTLQSNIFYHLGLAYYLKGDFKNALKAYLACEKVSKNPDMLVATKHWIYMTYRRLGRVKAAARAVAGIGDNLDIIENDDYYKLIKLYQGKTKAESLLSDNADDLGSVSLSYGVGNWYFYIGETEKNLDILRRIVSGNQWASFGYIAAEADLNRRISK